MKRAEIPYRLFEVLAGALLGAAVFAVTALIFFILYPVAFFIGCLASVAAGVIWQRRSPDGWWYVGCYLFAAFPASYLLWWCFFR